MVKHAHSQWFNALSELGVVGLVLLAVAMVLFVVAAVGNPFSRRRDPLHPLLVALQAGVIAFIVHMSWDWDWDMAAIGTIVFVFIAVCVSYRTTSAADARRAARRRAEDEPDDGPVGETAAANPGETAVPDEETTPAAESTTVEPAATQEERRHAHRSRRVRWPVRVVASTALVLLAVSWLPPYLALRAENAALAASGGGDVPAALEHARRAATLDPLAVSPLLTEASLLQQLGRHREALARLQEAARLQPQNYEVWYALGVLLHGALGRDKAARAALTRALALNPADAPSRYELELLDR